VCHTTRVIIFICVTKYFYCMNEIQLPNVCQQGQHILLHFEFANQHKLHVKIRETPVACDFYCTVSDFWLWKGMQYRLYHPVFCYFLMIICQKYFHAVVWFSCVVGTVRSIVILHVQASLLHLKCRRYLHEHKGKVHLTTGHKGPEGE